MDDAYIKHLRGDAPGSNVMETTYRHLSDDDAVHHAQVATGEKEPEPESALSPEKCPTCGEILEPDAKACSACGSVFTPDAKSAEEQIQADVKEDYRDTEPGGDGQDKLDALDHLLEDPDVKAALLDRMGES